MVRSIESEQKCKNTNNAQNFNSLLSSEVAFNYILTGKIQAFLIFTICTG